MSRNPYDLINEEEKQNTKNNTQHSNPYDLINEEEPQPTNADDTSDNVNNSPQQPNTTQDVLNDVKEAGTQLYGTVKKFADFILSPLLIPQ